MKAEIENIETAIEGLKGLKELLKPFVRKINLDNMGESDVKELEEHFNMAIEALNKQIPKRPVIKPWSPILCPSCGMEVSDWQGLNICDCGQKISWEVEK